MNRKGSNRPSSQHEVACAETKGPSSWCREAWVLCVDDSPTMRAVFRLAFTLWPNVRVVDSTDAALDAIEKRSASGLPPFGVLVLDIKMAPIDGFELARQVRTRSEYRHVPLLFLSGARDLEGYTEIARKLNGTIVSKRVGAGNQLVDIVESLLREKRTWWNRYRSSPPRSSGSFGGGGEPA